jgi:hypothetical protein
MRRVSSQARVRADVAETGFAGVELARESLQLTLHVIEAPGEPLALGLQRLDECADGGNHVVLSGFADCGTHTRLLECTIDCGGLSSKLDAAAGPLFRASLR